MRNLAICSVLFASCLAGCAGPTVFYKGQQQQLQPTSVIRVVTKAEKEQSFTFNPFKTNNITELKSFADKSLPVDERKVIKASVMHVPPGKYEVFVICTYSVYPVTISQSFNVDVGVEGSHDYTLECLGNQRSGTVNIVQRARSSPEA